LIENHFHIDVSDTGIGQDINPVFPTTTDSNSYAIWQLFQGDSLIAQIKTSVTRYHYSQRVFAESAPQAPAVLALG